MEHPADLHQGDILYHVNGIPVRIFRVREHDLIVDNPITGGRMFAVKEELYLLDEPQVARAKELFKDFGVLRSEARPAGYGLLSGQPVLRPLKVL